MAGKNFAPIEFVNYKLSEDEKKDFQTWSKDTADDIFTYVTTLLTQDYRLSLSYSYKDAMTIASVTCKDETSPNNQRCVSSRHSDPFTALQIACYKASVVMGDADWTELVAGTDWG